MRVDDLKAYYGCQSDAELARQLGFRFPSTVSNWRKRGSGLVPELQARRLAEETKGRRRNGVVLTFDRSTYE